MMVSWGGFCSSSTPYVKSLSCSLSDLWKLLDELLMCSGRKKPPEALQVQDQSTWKSRSMVSPLARGLETWLSAWGLFGVVNPFPSSSSEQEEWKAGDSSPGAEEHPVGAVPWRGGVWAGHGGLSVGWPHAHLPGPASALPWGVCMLECSPQPVGDGFATKCKALADLWKEPLWVLCGADYRHVNQLFQVTHYCSYSSLSPCAGSYPSLWARLPWITSQVPWGNTCI